MVGVPEREEGEKGPEKILKVIIAETCLIWERKLSSKSKKQITCKGISFRVSAGFSADSLQIRRERLDIFKLMKRKNP